MTNESTWTRRLASVSAVMAAVRIMASRTVGFGDSEALYACYARHPQASYRDHPGLVGQFASLLGHGDAPSPEVAHAASGAIATLVPWIFWFAARALGATTKRAGIGAIAFALVPEICVGLFAMTPDVLLAPLWLGALFAAAKVEKAPEERKNAWYFAAGFLAALSASAKVSGLLLLLAMLLWRGFGTKRPRALWLGAFGGALPFFAVLDFEARHQFPMLAHRFHLSEFKPWLGAGRSLGGQFLYLSPIWFALLLGSARSLWKSRTESRDRSLLALAMVVPGVPLLAYGIYSPTAEPHWLAPAWISLGLYATVHASWNTKLVATATVVAGALSVFVYTWVLAPDSPKWLPKSVDARYDITNELYGWNVALDRVKELRTERPDVIVVGAHWVICAQLHAALPRDVPVGCVGAPADFADWYPEAKWRDQAPYVLYVRDARIEGDPRALFPDRVVIREDRARTFRGGRPARIFTMTLLGKNAGG